MFDAHSMGVVTEETLIANHPNYVSDYNNDYADIEVEVNSHLQGGYDGVAVIDVRYYSSYDNYENIVYLGYDDDGVFETLATVPEYGSRLNYASAYDSDTEDYRQLMFTDIQGTEHLVTDAQAENFINHSERTFALDNGYHIITYSLLNSDGVSADTYCRCLTLIAWILLLRRH